MRKRFLFVVGFLLALQSVQAGIPDVKFRRLDTRDGLTNSQVNCVLRDSRGFVWLATPFGLCRYDGYRFRNFYSYERDTTTLRANRVDDIQEDIDGRLWLNHGMNYSVYDPVTESVDRTPSRWMSQRGVNGGIEKLYIDSKKNYWVKSYDDGFYFYNPQKKLVKRIPFGYGPDQFSKEFGVSAFAESKEGMVMVSTMGELMCVDGEQGKVVWKNDFVKRSLNAYNDYWLYIDKDGVTWVITHSTGTYIYVPTENRWYTSLTELMRARGFQNVPDDIVTWEVRYDQKGYLWVATDHMGVLLLDFKNKEWRQFTNVKGDESSLPDITAKHFYEDQMGRMWVSTYKNGVAMSADALTNFTTLPLGDINGICEDKNGYYWLGMNSGGILKFDPRAEEVVETFTKQSLGVPSDVVVGNYAARDGSLWFGTWEGGLICYRNGQWKNYRVGTPGCLFATNNIWGITEDYWGNIWVAVLGGGTVRIDRRTGRQRVFNEENAKLSTVWTNSISRASNGWILLGNSEYCSLVNPKTMKLINLKAPRDESTYTISTASTQVLMDANGLLWQGSPSGLSVYDRKTGQSKLLDMKSGFYGSSVVALAEDDRHTMWVVTDHGISNVTPQKDEQGRWTFAVRSFNDRDGLQPGPFNQRAICFTRDGHLLVGGQDGLDIINTRKLSEGNLNERPVFSGLVLQNDPIEVGVKYDGHVVLERALSLTETLHLRYSENQFTIEMGSDNGGVKNGTRFVYRLKGFNDKWVKTSTANPNITYMGLPAGSYTLCVRMLRGDGTMGEVESQLDIVIGRPWYNTWWSWLVYVLIAAGAAYWWMRKKKNVHAQPTETASHMNDTTSALEEPAAESVADDDVEEAVLMDDDDS